MAGERPSATEHRASYAGSGNTLFTLVFKNLFLTLLTLGVYLPWARTERRQYLWQNLELDGHRFRYHGTGKEMFRGYLKVAAGYVALIGLPALLTRVDRRAGIAAQFVGLGVLLLLLPIAIYGSRRYLLSRTSLRGIRFGLEPEVWGFFRLFLLGLLITILTFGLYAPAMANSLRRYVTERTHYGSAAFRYDGSNSRALNIALKGVLLSVVTLGLYYPWFVAEMAHFRVESTSIQGARAKLDLSGKDVFWLLVLSLFGSVVTLGIGFPWIATHVLRTVVSRLSLEGQLDYAAIQPRATAGDALADGLASSLDVGLEV